MGTRVCEEALQTGLAVVSINRSGPPKATAPWTSEVDWVSVRFRPLHDLCKAVKSRYLFKPQHQRHLILTAFAHQAYRLFHQQAP